VAQEEHLVQQPQRRRRLVEVVDVDARQRELQRLEHHARPRRMGTQRRRAWDGALERALRRALRRHQESVLRAHRNVEHRRREEREAAEGHRSLMRGSDGLQPIDEAHRERWEHNLGPELGQIPNRHLRHDDPAR